MHPSFFDFSKQAQPYEDMRESWADLLAFTDLLLLELCRSATSDPEHPRLHSISITFEDAPELLMERQSVRKRSPSDSCCEELQRARAYIAARTEITERANAIPFAELCHVFELSELCRVMLLLSLCPFFDGKYDKIFAILRDERTGYAPTLGIALAACELLTFPEKPTALSIDSKTFSLLFQTGQSSCGLGTALTPSPVLVRAANGSFDLAQELELFCAYYDWVSPMAELTFNADLAKRLEKIVLLIDAEERYRAPRALLLCAREGAGRFFLIRHVMRSLRLGLLEVDLSHLPLYDEDALQNLLTGLERQLILRPSLICLRGCAHMGDEARAEQITRLIEGVAMFSPLFWISAEPEENAVIHAARISILEFSVPAPSYGDTAALFAQYAAMLPVSPNVDFDAIASCYRLLPGEICRALEFARMLAYQHGRQLLEQQDLMDGLAVCRTHKMGALGDVLSTQYTMEDLITTPANRELMSLAISHIKYRIVVRDRWGMDKKNAYGRGVCILFYGPSGTGKTMAAQAMAHEIGMDLFRVDSSQLTSKYVGETSKNMRQIFDDARSSNTILFFDEADAIFGKRTDASDATGRYANGDTAFLLQKIEEYDGMVILSTNLLYNIDEAFRRRITYMVNFSMPDRELREQMWRSMIPEEMPTRELDFPFLSKYELTGSSIKSILISAAYMAASSEDVLDMRAVLRSVQIFMTKQGKHLAPNDLIPYDALLKF